MGIVGMGRIGFELAKKCFAAWEMRIIYSVHNNRNPRAEEELKAEPVSLEELLKNSDFVSVRVPLNEQTKKLCNEKFFGLMKHSAIFINTSRGGIVD